MNLTGGGLENESKRSRITGMNSKTLWAGVNSPFETLPGDFRFFVRYIFFTAIENLYRVLGYITGLIKN
jgi:hypothetical protein